LNKKLLGSLSILVLAVAVYFFVPILIVPLFFVFAAATACVSYLILTILESIKEIHREKAEKEKAEAMKIRSKKIMEELREEEKMREKEGGK